MQDCIINIHPSELLSTKIKESRITYRKKKKNLKKVLHNKFFFFFLRKNMDNLHFIPNIITNFFKELTKYKMDYQ